MVGQHIGSPAQAVKVTNTETSGRRNNLVIRYDNSFNPSVLRVVCELLNPERVEHLNAPIALPVVQIFTIQSGSTDALGCGKNRPVPV